MNPMQMQIDAEKTKLLEARLTDTEKGYLFQFCQTPGMVLAVEKALLFSIYQMGTVYKDDKQILDVNWAYIPSNVTVSDEQLGHELRIKSAALGFMDDAFQQIKKFGVEKVEPKEESNPAV